MMHGLQLLYVPEQPCVAHPPDPPADSVFLWQSEWNTATTHTMNRNRASMHKEPIALHA